MAGYYQLKCNIMTTAQQILDRYRTTEHDYQAILDHLLRYDLCFCFLETGEFVSREKCLTELEKHDQA